MPITKLQNRDIILAIWRKQDPIYSSVILSSMNSTFKKKRRIKKIERVFDRNPLQACQRHWLSVFSNRHKQ